MTKEEFDALLEEAFLAGYNDAEEDFLNKDNSFDLEREYNESSLWDRAAYAKNVVANKIKYRGDKKLEGLANRAAAARIGTQQAADKEDRTVMDTYKKYDKASKDKLINSHDNYVTKKHIENKYNYKLKRAIKDRAAQQPADNKSKQPKPAFRPAFV